MSEREIIGQTKEDTRIEGGQGFKCTFETSNTATSDNGSEGGAVPTYSNRCVRNTWCVMQNM
jgi:hypothetical protein